MNNPPPLKLTKILATLGPATERVETICQLIHEGVRVFRINFSHGSLEDFSRLLRAVRQASEQLDIPIGVLGDICGPKIRIGKVAKGGIELNAGDRILLQAEPMVAHDNRPGSPPSPSNPGEASAAASEAGQPANASEATDENLLAAREGILAFSVTLPSILDDVQVGDRVLIDDGAIRALVVEKRPAVSPDASPRLVASITVGGLITSSKGLNLPDSQLRVPAITARDWETIDWACQNQVDYLALSFVRKASDVRELKIGLKQRKASIPIIAKIEKPQAITELNAILTEASGVMVARGDLGVEMDLAQVPVIQKQIITAAQTHGKPVIVATQMLQTMIDNPYPTRAEVSDVANALFEGTDAVMLSGETAVGKYPIQTVSMMSSIISETQHHLVQTSTRPGARVDRAQLDESPYRTAALAEGVTSVVRSLRAKLVVTWSQRGGSARYLARTRMLCPIVAASDEPLVLRQLTLLYGVYPVLMPLPANLEAFAHRMDRLVREKEWANLGDSIVFVAGEPIGVPGVTNTLWIHYLGDVCKIR